MRAVIIDPAYLGDAVFDAPLARAIKHRYAGSHVGLVVRPPADALARRIPWVDRVHAFDKRGRHRGLLGLRAMARELEEARYDVAYVCHPSARSSLLASRAGIPVRIGSTRDLLARLWLTDRRPSRPDDGFVARRLALLGPFESGDERLEGALSALRPERSGVLRRVGLSLGSEWETKRWPPERAVELARLLAPGTEQPQGQTPTSEPKASVGHDDRSPASGLGTGRVAPSGVSATLGPAGEFTSPLTGQVRLVVIGAERERPLLARLLDLLEPERQALVEDAMGGGVDALVERIAGLDVLVAGDTGPLYIARALGVPVVALFGPTSAARHAFGPTDTVLSEELPCRPCSEHGQRRCPLAHHRCMRELPGERVHGAVVRALDRLAL